MGSTYILLSWSPPAIPNGRIISYTITYNLTGQLTSVVVEDREQYSVTGLEPFSYYQLTVFASTSVGDGPPTLPIIQRTAISSKCVFQETHMTNLIRRHVYCIISNFLLI